MATIIGTDGRNIFYNDDSGTLKIIPWVSNQTGTQGPSGSFGSLNAASFGVVGDARVVQDGSATNGSPVISSPTIAFTQADVGKAVWIAEVGTITGPKTLGQPSPIIISVQDSQHATMSGNAVQTNTGTITMVVGTDNTAAFAAAFAALFATTGGKIVIPIGAYLVLGNWGTLGNDKINNYSIVGVGPYAPNANSAAENGFPALTTIITSPYNTYSTRFLTREFSGSMADIAFTDLGITNINHASFSNLSLFYDVDVPIFNRNISYQFGLPAGQGNIVRTITPDVTVSENEYIYATGCGGASLEGGGKFLNLNVIGGEFGVSMPVQGNSHYVGGTWQGTAGPGLLINGSVQSSFPQVFDNVTFIGSGIGTNAAVVTTAGGAAFDIFNNCNFNFPSANVSPTGNYTALHNALGNTLILNGGYMAAFGSGFAIENAGRVIMSDVVFPTANPWSANTPVVASSTNRMFVQDPAGHLQLVTTTGITGALIPVFNDSNSTTDDNTAVWTDQGVAATLFSNTGVGSIIDGGGNFFGVNPSTIGSGFFGAGSITGTACLAANIVPASSWGTTGAAGNGVSAVSGNTKLIQFTVTATGSPSSDPAITINFPTKFFQAPICRLVQVGGTNFTDVTLPVVTTGPSISSVTFTFSGTPIASHVYIFQLISDLG